MQEQCRAQIEPILFRDPREPRSNAGADDSSELSYAGLARAIIRARAARRQFFDTHLFADPAWDMLLELYALESEGHRVSVSKLSVAAGVPGTTGLRWIDKLESERLVVRTGDPLDGRRFWVELSALGSRIMREYLEQIPVRLPRL